MGPGDRYCAHFDGAFDVLDVSANEGGCVRVGHLVYVMVLKTRSGGMYIQNIRTLVYRIG